MLGENVLRHRLVDANPNDRAGSSLDSSLRMKSKR